MRRGGARAGARRDRGAGPALRAGAGPRRPPAGTPPPPGPASLPASGRRLLLAVRAALVDMQRVPSRSRRGDVTGQVLDSDAINGNAVVNEVAILRAE